MWDEYIRYQKVVTLTYRKALRDSELATIGDEICLISPSTLDLTDFGVPNADKGPEIFKIRSRSD